jgi:FMN phosphatase YigB (HAD superfamily)
MHATKPNTDYYREILQRIEVEPSHALMVGDDWENDIVPAASVGCFTDWLPESDAAVPPDFEGLTKSGSLDELYALLSSGWLAG